mgnify:CR=1 FL=1
MEEKLEVVNEKDEVIGSASREEIHQKGLLHREVHVYFVTADNHIIFQRRGWHKDTYPGLLDATVGGHVAPGESYLGTVIRETAEETGLKLAPQDFRLILKNRRRSFDEKTGATNNCLGESYLYLFSGRAEELRVEAGDGAGFEAWSFEDIEKADADASAGFIPYIYNFSNQEVIPFARESLGAFITGIPKG